MTNRANRFQASAPGKVILFGEHAINRGQPALAGAVGLRTNCWAEASDRFRFRSGTQVAECSREDVVRLGDEVEEYRRAQNYEAIRALSSKDYFGPQKYVIASMFRGAVPEGLSLVWESEIPERSGLGSGGAAFTAMVGACLPFLARGPELLERAGWAQLGDVVAHGGVASGLDTQTSLLGGLIQYTGKGLANLLSMEDSLSVVVAHTGIQAPTAEVNTKVRVWLEENRAARLPYFETVGALTRAAESALKKRDQLEVGKLMNLNQLVLEKIGVSCPEAERLIAKALSAGAFGAKISGSGGGGIIVALTSSGEQMNIAAALERTGALVFATNLGGPGLITDPMAKAA